MYWNDIMARKARTILARLRRQSRVRPYRERTEITPLLSNAADKHSRTLSNGLNGKNGTAIHVQNQLYPIEEDFSGEY